jgi:hypothetical protein
MPSVTNLPKGKINNETSVKGVSSYYKNKIEELEQVVGEKQQVRSPFPLSIYTTSTLYAVSKKGELIRCRTFADWKHNEINSTLKSETSAKNSPSFTSQVHTWEKS